MKKVLFIDPTHDILPQRLTENGFECEYINYDKEEEYEAILPLYDGIIIRSKFPIDRRFIDKATNLKFIGRPGAGLENIDIQYAEKKGIKCFNSPEGNRDAVGEQTLGMLLMLLNKLYACNTEVKQGSWNRKMNRGIELKGKTVGIIGYGNMGSSFAQKLSGMEVNCIAYDKYKKDFSSEIVTECSLNDIFELADIVSMHIPLTEETDRMVDQSFFKQFKKPIMFLNTARGKILNTDDLVEAMKQKKVIGAALDVLEYEKTSFESLFKEDIPEAFKYLKDADNVLLSPHVAGWTHESNIKISSVIADKIIANFKA